MKNIQEQQKQEAIARMEMLKLYPNIIKEFRKDGIVNMSETHGFLYWLTDEKKGYIEKFEAEYNVLVYHVIRSFTEFGELLSFLYVSKHEEEWDYDRDDLKEGYACVYVKNLDDECCSEFGSIGIRQQSSGLVRIY